MDRHSFLANSLGALALASPAPNLNQCCGLPPFASAKNTRLILISSQRGPYETSNDVRLILVAENFGRKRVVIANWGAPFAISLTVTDQQGIVVRPDHSSPFPRKEWTDMAVDLAPGEVTTFYAQYGDGTHREESSLFPLDDWGYTLAAPGQYFITATYLPQLSDIVSNTIRVDLNAAK
jgi:hypothetical protein